MYLQNSWAEIELCVNFALKYVEVLQNITLLYSLKTYYFELEHIQNPFLNFFANVPKMPKDKKK